MMSVDLGTIQVRLGAIEIALCSVKRNGLDAWITVCLFVLGESFGFWDTGEGEIRFV